MKKFLVLFACAIVSVGAAHADVMSKKATVSMLGKKQDILTSSEVKTSGSGAVVSAISADDGVITVEKENVKIPAGGKDSDSYAAIWVE